MLYEIQQLKSPNFEDRYGQVPILFVLHITDGQDAARDSDAQEESAVDNTFMSTASQCSSHGGIERDGRIKQYVDIMKTAWTQGLHGNAEELAALSPIVRQLAGVNPNYYSIGIEFLAYKDHGGDGNITEEQFWSGCWLMKYWQEQTQKMYNHKIPLNSTFVIGHCHIDQVYRKFDPGINFPWQRLFAELVVADSMTLQDYEGRIQYLRSDRFKAQQCYQVGNEIDWMYGISSQQDGVGEWARSFLLKLIKAFDKIGVLPDKYSATNDYMQFRNDVLWLYNSSLGKNAKEDIAGGIWALTTMYPYLLQNGLVNPV